MIRRFIPSDAIWFAAWCVALVTIIGVFTTSGVAEDDLGARIAAAERYANSVDFDQWFDEIVGAELANLDGRQRSQALRQLKQELSPQTIRNIVVNAMVQVMTAAELNALADFYSTPLGRSALRKVPQAYNAMSSALEIEVVRAIAAIRDKAAR